jgi:methyl-accepting chemotaxis protein
MLKHIKVAHNVALLAIALLLLLLLTGASAYQTMSQIGREIHDIAEYDVPIANQLSELSENQQRHTLTFEQTLLSIALDTPRQTNALSAELATLDQAITQLYQTLGSQIKLALSASHDEAIKVVLKEKQSSLRQLQQGGRNLSQQRSSLLQQAQQQGVQSIKSSLEALEQQQQALNAKILAMSQQIRQLTLQAAQRADVAEQQGIQRLVILLVIALLLGGGLSWLISRSIVIPLQNMSARLKHIASGDGDLTQTLDDSGNSELSEIGRDFNRFLAVLRRLITDSNNNADELGKSSETALRIMRETLENVERQYVETEQVATAVNEMSATTEDVARSSNHASDVTEQVRTQVLNGREGAEVTQATISRLAQEIDNASNVVSALVEETRNIAVVLDTIQSIAEQTNLLALNAAIEAARAGEQGRGFAVVADEVRSLAQRTHSSTEDIQKLVQRLQTEANNAVNSMRSGQQASEECLQQSQATAATFEQASEAVNQITDLNHQIAAAAEEQASVAVEINQSLNSISDLAEVTTQGAKETHAANENIAMRLIDLHTKLNRFKTE